MKRSGPYKPTPAAWFAVMVSITVITFPFVVYIIIGVREILKLFSNS